MSSIAWQDVVRTCLKSCWSRMLLLTNSCCNSSWKACFEDRSAHHHALHDSLIFDLYFSCCHVDQLVQWLLVLQLSRLEWFSCHLHIRLQLFSHGNLLHFCRGTSCGSCRHREDPWLRRNLQVLWARNVNLDSLSWLDKNIPLHLVGQRIVAQREQGNIEIGDWGQVFLQFDWNVSCRVGVWHNFVLDSACSFGQHQRRIESTNGFSPYSFLFSFFGWVNIVQLVKQQIEVTSIMFVRMSSVNKWRVEQNQSLNWMLTKVMRKYDSSTWLDTWTQRLMYKKWKKKILRLFILR